MRLCTIYWIVLCFVFVEARLNRNGRHENGFRKALDSSSSVNNLGQTHRPMKHDKKSKKGFRKALDSSSSVNNLGQTHRPMKHDKKSKKGFRKALDSSSSLNNLGQTHRPMKHDKKSKKGFRKALDSSSSVNNLGQTHRPMKHDKKSKKGHAKWNYGDSEHGPDVWSDLFPSRCGGLYQSPIDIVTEETIYQRKLKKFTFTVPSPGSKFVVQCNGHTVQVNTKGNFYINGGGLKNTYQTEQFHFHWGDYSQYGSEHTVDGLDYPIELHIVNWNSGKYKSLDQAAKHSDGVAVLAVLFEVSRYDNPVLEKIIEAIPFVRDPDLDKRLDITAMSLRNLLPRTDTKYYRYQGSLTTPTCLQSVIWTVYEQKLPISERQLNVFRNVFTHKIHGSSSTDVGQGLDVSEEPGHVTHAREILVNNNRPVQPLNGRTVFRSFPYLTLEP